MWPSSRPCSKVRSGELLGRKGQDEWDGGSQVTSCSCLTYGVTKAVPKPCDAELIGERCFPQRARCPRGLPGSIISPCK